MRGKVARALRKAFVPDEKEYYDSRWAPIGSADYAIINGVTGKHRVETRDVSRFYSSNDRRLYRKMKKCYLNVNDENHSELRKDIQSKRK